MSFYSLVSAITEKNEEEKSKKIFIEKENKKEEEIKKKRRNKEKKWRKAKRYFKANRIIWPFKSISEYKKSIHSIIWFKEEGSIKRRWWESYIDSSNTKEIRYIFLGVWSWFP